MNHHYEDIRSKIDEAPQWWDEHAVPRYCAFAPGECADIYADIAVLLLIECQNCGRSFNVGMTQHKRDWKDGFCLTPEWVQTLHYGDPPNAGCCAAGPTMNSVPIRVVECWKRHHEEYTKRDPELNGMSVCLPGYFDWRRVPELEVPLDCEWSSDPSPGAI